MWVPLKSRANKRLPEHETHPGLPKVATLRTASPSLARPPHARLSVWWRGRAFLEEEGLIDREEGLDLDVMVGTLIQISLMTDKREACGLVDCTYPHANEAGVGQ